MRELCVGLEIVDLMNISGTDRPIDSSASHRRASLRRHITTPRLLLALAVLVPLGIAFFLTAKNYLLAPRVLRLSLDHDRELFKAVQDALVRHNQRIRLEIRDQPDQSSVLADFSSRRADLAVVRTDSSFPPQARSVVILRSSPILFFVNSTKTEISEIVDKPVGIVSEKPEDMATIEAILSYWDARPRRHETFAGLAPAVQALKEKRISSIALFIAGPENARRELAKLLQPNSQALNLLSFPDLSAFVETNPGFSEHKFEPGSLSIKPKLPAEEAKTIAFEQRLVTHESISRDDIAALTEALFKYRVEIAQRNRSINAIKTIDNDYVTSSLFPVHVGALDYFRREQMNFYERYNDIIWLGIFYGGSILSGFYWLLQTFVTRRRNDRTDFMSNVSEIVSDAGSAHSLTDLRRLEDEMARLMKIILTEAKSRHLSRTDIGAAALALTMARSIIDAKYRVQPTPSNDAAQAHAPEAISSRADK